MLKKLKPVANFHIWHDYYTMRSYAQEIRDFIDAGILELYPEYFKTLFEDAEQSCVMFYRGMQSKLGFTDEIDFPHIDFAHGIYEIEIAVDAEFNEREFLFGNLNLKPEYRAKVEAVLTSA